MWTYIIVGFVILIIIGFMQQAKKTTNSKQDKEKELSDKYGLDKTKKLFSGQYLGGHPSINISCYLRVYSKDDRIEFVHFFIEQVTEEKVGLSETSQFEFCGEIKFDKIKDITLEDASTIESRISAGRMLLVGALALAWKKKEKQECAYLIIHWNDGRFNHDTLFEFTGKGALQAANIARNNTINAVKSSETLKQVNQNSIQSD